MSDVNAHINNPICTQGFGLRHHARQGFLPGLLQQLGIAFELAAENILYIGHNISANIFGAHRTALHHTQVSDNGFTRYNLYIAYKQLRIPFVVGCLQYFNSINDFLALNCGRSMSLRSIEKDQITHALNMK